MFYIGCYLLKVLVGVQANKKIYNSLKTWISIYKPKVDKGLSFKLFNDINKALLAKLPWKLIANENAF